MAVFNVILTNHNGPCQSPFLPMDRYEAEQLLYTLGLDAPGAEHGMELLTGYSGIHIDPGTDLRALNRLARRIEDMGERERDAFRAWNSTQGRCSVEDALRASYQAREWSFYPGFGSDELLGEHALDNDLMEDYNSLPDEVYAMLDRAKVGEQFREQDGGVFANGGYLVAGDIAGLDYPPEEPLPFFQVRFNNGQEESAWFDVPLSEADAGILINSFGPENFHGLKMDCRSSIPPLSGLVSGADELPELHLLDKALTGMDGDEIQKYKALLEIAQPGNASAALRLAEEKAFYYVVPGYADPATFGLQHALARHNFDAGRRLLDYVDFAAYGAAMLNAEGYESTRYGAVYRNAMAQKILAGPNTRYSGDFYCGRTEGFPTCVCWDPDAQKVWLELNDGTADSGMVKDMAYYQGICEEWGVRHCASQEGLEQVLDELGAQPYDQVMAAEDDQGMGAMRGMA